LIEEFSYMSDFKLIVNKKLYDNISDSGTHYTQFNIISDNTDNNEELNDEVIKLLLDKKVITKESLSKLIDRNKIHIKDESTIP
jgi:hypothetical protein